MTADEIQAARERLLGVVDEAAREYVTSAESARWYEESMEIVNALCDFAGAKL